MYNKIAYFSYLLSLILLLIVMIDWIIIDLINQKLELPLVMIGILLSGLYKKIYTIPITEAWQEYWNSRTEKNDSDRDGVKSKTYEEYKKQKEE